MIRKFIIALAALSLTACAPGLFPGIAGPGAPLERTTIDDRGLQKAWQVFDLTLDAINLLGDVGVIVPGSPTGRAVATGIRATNKALAVAEHAAAGGSARDYTTALTEIDAALAGLRSTITAIKGN